MFKKILIANRGEIALRIQRACHEMGIATVAVHSTADSHAMHVRLATESVCIGPPRSEDSYLNIPALISACQITGAEAVHPGYGFLAENGDFASILQDYGIFFIGPKPEHIRMMGDKIMALETMHRLGLPTIPGSRNNLVSIEDFRAAAAAIGYPVLLKAAAGGGGRGMKQICHADEMGHAVETARSETRAAFGDDRLYIEKFLDHPRHIEFQLLGDSMGSVIHLGERDCSLQRRFQKIWEESPSPVISTPERDAMGQRCVRALAEIGYIGAATVEFLYQDGAFYFIEVNARIQVEHPVTEMVTGIDLVKEQIRIASGAPLSQNQSDIRWRGAAVECRINAENPRSFTPAPGTVTNLHVPGGPGVRIDMALYNGYRIPPHYDSLIGKLIVHGDNRQECLMRLQRCLDEFVIEGIETTLPLFQQLVRHDAIRKADYDIHWLENFLRDNA